MVDGLSVNTNTSANIALSQLRILNQKLESTQLRITTGLKVSGPQDDAATFQIATRLRGDVAGLGAVKTALQNGDSIVSVAISAGAAITCQLSTATYCAPSRRTAAIPGVRRLRRNSPIPIPPLTSSNCRTAICCWYTTTA